MKEVKRYRFKGAAGEYVYAADHDAAQKCAEEYGAKIIEQQSELSALREELADLSGRYAKMQTGEEKILNRVIAERDEADEETSALREIIRDLKDWRECSQSLAAFTSVIERAEAVIPAPGPLRKALTAAEQRNAESRQLLHDWKCLYEDMRWGDATTFAKTEEFLSAQPTESGASE
jgi:chromosome segregation ATPase